MQNLRVAACGQPRENLQTKNKNLRVAACGQPPVSGASREDMIEKMRKETGMGMKMYKREELMGMSEGPSARCARFPQDLRASMLLIPRSQIGLYAPFARLRASPNVASKPPRFREKLCDMFPA